MKKRLLASLLAVALLVSNLGITSYATEGSLSQNELEVSGESENEEDLEGEAAEGDIAGEAAEGDIAGEAAEESVSDNSADLTEEKGIEETVSADSVDMEKQNTGLRTASTVSLAAVGQVGSGVTTVSDILVNPLYEDIISEEELEAELDKIRSQASSSDYRISSTESTTTYETLDAAAAYLRQQMVERNTSVTMAISTSLIADAGGNVSQESFVAGTRALVDKAMEHTESCSGEEGDALKCMYGGYRASYQDGNLILTISYHTTKAQEEELTVKVKEIMTELALEGKTDIEKVRAIHDKLCDLVDYDFDNLNDDTYLLKYSSYAALCKGKAVCNGYAAAFYRLCKEAGLPVRVITGLGNGGNHAWNIVKVGDFYYNIDCTWDGQDTTTNYNYYLQNEIDFVKHTRDAEYDTEVFHTTYPMAEHSYGKETVTLLNKGNLSYSFTTIEDATVQSAAEEIPKVLIFFDSTDESSQELIKSIADQGLVNVDIYAIDIVKASRDNMSAFKAAYGNDGITFCYDITEAAYNAMWSYVATAQNITSGQLSARWPVICYIDSNNVFQYMGEGGSSGAQVEYNLTRYCNYTSGTGSNGEGGTSSGTITTLADFQKALQDGGSYTISGTISASRPENGDEPLVVEKAVSFSGGTIETGYGGIVLGADASFEGTNLSFSNGAYLGIFANGYNLSLKDLTISWSATDPFSIAAGGFQNNADFTAAAGTGSEITLDGVTFTSTNSTTQDVNIYSGNVYDITPAEVSDTAQAQENADAGVAYSVSFSIKNISGSKPVVYGHGATYRGFLPGNTGASTADYDKISPAEACKTTGGVAVSLQKGTDVTQVNGATGVANTGIAMSFSSSDGNASTLNAKNLSGLTLVSGTNNPNLSLANSGSSSFYSGASVSVPAGTKLDLSAMGDLSIGSFSGGGTLVLGKEQLLTITGTVTGTTEVEVTGISGSTGGKPDTERTYIVAASSGENSFSLVPPTVDTGLSFTFDSSVGSWSIPAADDELDKISSVSLLADMATVTFSAEETVRYEGLDVVWVNDGFGDLGWYPLEWKYNDSADSITRNGPDDYAYYGYTLTIGQNSYSMEFSDNTLSFYLNGLASALPEGSHRFTMIVPGEYMEAGVDEEVIFTIKVGETAEEPGTVITDAAEPVITTQPSSAEYGLNGEVTALRVEAEVTDGGSLSYQWYSNTTESSQGGEAIQGAVSQTYSPSAAEAGTFYYYCVVTNTNTGVNGNKTAAATSTVATITVSKGAGNADVTMAGWIYGEQSSAPVSSSATHGTAQVTYSYEGTTKAGASYGPSAEIPTEAGDYTVTAVFAATADYEEIRITKNFTIEAAPLTIASVKIADKVYDGTLEAVVEQVIFHNEKGEAVVLVAEKDYLVEAAFTDGQLGENKQVMVTVTLKNQNYTLAQTTVETTGNICQTVIKNAAEPVITTQPSSAEYGLNGEVTALRIEAEVADGGSLSYQWYRNETKSSQGGEAIQGAVSQTYSPSSAEIGTVYYYCMVTNTNTEVNGNKTAVATSTVATITVSKGSGDGYDLPGNIWVNGIKEEVEYTGTKITQDFRVYDGDTLLKEKVDYTYSYKNNTNAYTYDAGDYAQFEKKLEEDGKRVKVGTFDPAKAPQIVIKMKGNYSGSHTIYYQICPIDLVNEKIVAGDLAVTYTGRKQTPVPTVTWAGKKLVNNKDFYVKEYKDNKVFVGSADQRTTERLTLVGKGNFTGEKTIQLIIGQKNSGLEEIPISKVKVSGVKTLVWSGTESAAGYTQKDLVVKNAGAELKEGEDYSLSYENNQAVGTAALILTGTGTDGDGDGKVYIGTRRLTFKITGTSMSKVDVSGLQSSYIYTGKAIEPTELSSAENGGQAIKLTSKVSGETLKADIHYTVDYQKNEDVGTATLILRGVEEQGYTGTLKKNFKIVPAQYEKGKEEPFTAAITDARAKGTAPCRLPYMKGGVLPEVTVTAKDGTVLTAGKDYTVSYKNNKAVADCQVVEAKKAPTVVVKGKGNYKGTLELPFTIEKKNLAAYPDVYLVAKDKVESTRANKWKQSFKVYDADGKVLNNQDFIAGEARYTIKSVPEGEDESLKGKDLVADPNVVVPAGSVIEIEVDMIGTNYEGTVKGTYRILKTGYDISKATIRFNDQYYTGKAVEPAEGQIKTATIKRGGKTEELKYGEDFQVVEGSYVNNRNKGTAKVTLEGIGEYGGTKTVTFKIKQRSIVDFWEGLFQLVLP